MNVSGEARCQKFLNTGGHAAVSKSGVAAWGAKTPAVIDGSNAERGAMVFASIRRKM